jgi:hypothetical protein
MCGWQTAQFQFARSTYKDGEQQREREIEKRRREEVWLSPRGGAMPLLM